MIGPEDTDILIARVAMGERDAFRKLYAATSNQLFGICMRVLQNDIEAEDVLHNVFVSVWEDADGFRHTAVTSDLLLVLQARRMAISLKRVRRSEPSEIETRDLYTRHEDSGAPIDARAPHHTDFTDALATLQPARALLLERVVVDGESYDDLAVASDVDTPTIRASMHKTLGKVSHAFDSSVHDDDADAIAAAERALGLNSDAGLNEASADEDTWNREIGAFVLRQSAPIAPPSQVLRRIEARVFNDARESLWEQLWPYAIGGGIAALVLWIVTSSDILLELQ